MNTFRIEDINDIDVFVTKWEAEINFHDRRGTNTVIELTRPNAELLSERLREALARI